MEHRHRGATLPEMKTSRLRIAAVLSSQEETGEPRFSPQHVHIFITALRSFCVGKAGFSDLDGFQTRQPD